MKTLSSILGCLFFLVQHNAVGTAYGEDITWVQRVVHASWSPRDSMGEVVYKDKMWLLGGYTPTRVNEVWSSSDGLNWTQVTPHAAWGERNLLCSVVFNNKMWIYGGGGGTGSPYIMYNDVWSSSDGTNWTSATLAAPWAARSAAGAVVYNGKMWIAGGMNAPDNWTHYNDVWYSADGANWTRATAAAPWAPRAMLSMLVFDNKMWILGGGVYNETYPLNTVVDYNDVWYSTDGANWTRATAAAQWAPRRFHCSVVYDGKMWVIEGFSLGNCADVWYSSDGVNWTEATSSAPKWSNRHESSCLVFKNSLWLMGGNSTPPLQNDIWTYSAPLSSLSATLQLSNYAGDIPSVGVIVELRQNGGVVRTEKMLLNSQGKFTVPDVESGIYDITIKSAPWLRNLLPQVNVRGTIDLGTLTLFNGDADGDNEVTSADLSIILRNME